MEKVKHIVSFSGGKDSTAMLLKMIEAKMQIDEIVFLDTTVEFPEMYEHIEKVKKYINRDITILKADNSYEFMMFDYVKKKGKNKGQKGYSWADFRTRWCTIYLKQNVIKKYLKKYKDYKIIEYIGLAADETKRLERKKDERDTRFPLVDWGITEKQALEYCYSKGFDWGGLYTKFDRVSCWCCPLKSLKELRVLYKDFPYLWEKLKEWDNKTYRKFRADYSIEELEEKFKKEECDDSKK